jgi:hypothetical protein
MAVCSEVSAPFPLRLSRVLRLIAGARGTEAVTAQHTQNHLPFSHFTYVPIG